MSLILSNSPPDNPSTDDIIAIIDYVCGSACKDSEPTGATADLFKDMVNAVDATDADQVTGKSMCAKMLIKTVGRRDISGPEASFELSGLALCRCSRSFTYLSMSGSRRLERDGDRVTRSTPLDKYLARAREEKDFDYDDGGDEYDWNSTCIILPEGRDPKKWLQERIREDEEQEAEPEDLEFPQVSLLSLNENQRAIVSLVLHTLYNFLENLEDYHPLRLVVSGNAGTGKSYVIECLQRLVRQVVGVNDAIQVITPTGKAAYLVKGRTAHSFLGIPTDGRSCNELTVPSGPLLERIQKKCENMIVLVGDERSMFGRTTMGWMDARYAVNRGTTAHELWGGCLRWCLWEMMYSYLLYVTLPCTFQILAARHLTMVAWYGLCSTLQSSLLRL